MDKRELSIKEFESLNLFNNRNMERIVGSLVNRSSNAVMVSMFEDSAILFDHEDGQFYIADYKFDPKKLTLKLEGFEPVELKREANDFRDKVYEFFDDEESDTTELVEAYKDDVIAQEKYIDQLIHDSMKLKDFSEVINYSQIREALEDEEVMTEDFFKAYKKRLDTHPLNEIKLFDWENPVIVSLCETEKKKIINTSAIKKANDLWKNDNFQEDFRKVAQILVDDVEEGVEEFKALLEEYPQIFWLDKADRKTMFGKAILADSTLSENSDLLVKGITILFDETDIAQMRAEYLKEAKGDESEDEISADDMEEEKPKKDKKEDKPEVEEEPDEEAPELTPEQLQKLADTLKKVAKKIDDEKAKSQLDSVISKLEGGKEEGTKPEVVKEAVSILSL